MVYARHRRRSKRYPRHSNKLLGFVSQQEARLDEGAVKAGCVMLASALANNDTITIGSRTYTLKDSLTDTNGFVKRSGTLATDLGNLVKAINLTGVAGTDYAASQTAHADVTASSDATHLTVEAKVAGAAGNAIATTETSSGAAWATTTMTGGLDASDFDCLDSLKRNTAEEIKLAADKDDLA